LGQTHTCIGRTDARQPSPHGRSCLYIEYEQAPTEPTHMCIIHPTHRVFSSSRCVGSARQSDTSPRSNDVTTGSPNPSNPQPRLQDARRWRTQFIGSSGCVALTCMRMACVYVMPSRWQVAEALRRPSCARPQSSPGPQQQARCRRCRWQHHHPPSGSTP